MLLLDVYRRQLLLQSLRVSILMACCTSVSVATPADDNISGPEIIANFAQWSQDTELSTVITLKTLSLNANDKSLIAVLIPANPQWSIDQAAAALSKYNEDHFGGDISIVGVLKAKLARTAQIPVSKVTLNLDAITIPSPSPYVSKTVRTKAVFSMPMDLEVRNHQITASQLDDWIARRFSKNNQKVVVQLSETDLDDPGSCYFEGYITGCRNIIVKSQNHWERLQLTISARTYEDTDSKKIKRVACQITFSLDGQYAGGAAPEPRLAEYRDMEPRYTADLLQYLHSMANDLKMDIERGLPTSIRVPKK